jgi:histidine triad (HIT) family protein
MIAAPRRACYAATGAACQKRRRSVTRDTHATNAPLVWVTIGLAPGGDGSCSLTLPRAIRDDGAHRAEEPEKLSTMDCFVCRKHRDRGLLLPGGPVAEDDLVLVSHIVTPDLLGREGTTAYLGHLFIEPLRHAPCLAALTDAEARSMGWWCARASRALREVAGAEHVYAAVIGDEVPHLHVHLLPRFPGTPREYWWTRVDEWPQARRGDAAEIAVLVGELRSYLAHSATLAE